ncbi:MAG: DUF4397 domain-containing protein [Gammaproteobacteria bacterium]
MRTKARHVKFVAILLSAIALIGCDQGQKPSARTRVHVVNAAPSFAQLWYQREHPPTEAPEPLAFKAVSAHDYDVDTYDFFAYHRRVSTQEILGTWTWVKELVADQNYTFVLTEEAGQVSPQIVEYSPKLANATDTQFAVVHAGATLPSMDVYVQPAGISIAGATPRGSIDFRGQIAAKTLASGDYEITLTAAGDPSSVLFAASAVTLAAGVTNVFVIESEGGQGTEAISVVMAQDSPFVLYSTNATSGARVLNLADDGAARDFAVNHEYTPPLLPAVPFGTITSYVNVPINATLPITVTPAGNPGVLELDTTMSTPPGALATVLFAGPAGTLTSQIVADDRRRNVDEAKLRFFNGANQFTTVTEMVLAPVGADQATIIAFTGLGAPALSDYLYSTPGEFDLYFRENGTNAVRAGPIHVNLVSGGIYGFLTLNGADTSTVSVVFTDDTP